MVTYFTDEDDADQLTTDAAVEAALSLAGAWSDVSWDELEAGLDRIRHESCQLLPLNYQALPVDTGPLAA